MAAQASATAAAATLPLSFVSSSTTAAQPADVGQPMSTAPTPPAATTASAPATAPGATDAPVDVSAAEELAFKPRPSMDLFKAIFEDDEDVDAQPPVIPAPTSSGKPVASQMPQTPQPTPDEPKQERAAIIGPLIPAEFRRLQPDEPPAMDVVDEPPPASMPTLATAAPEIHTTLDDTPPPGVDRHIEKNAPEAPPVLVAVRSALPTRKLEGLQASTAVTTSALA